MYIFFMSVTAALIICIICLIVYMLTTFKKLDAMLDSAINGEFAETSFTEHRLSRLQSKLYHYLLAKQVAQGRITEEQNAIKTLVSDISHQTKTPVANILLYTQLLKESDALGEKEREMLSMTEEQTEKLQFLIQALIKISRLENGIITLTPKKGSIAFLMDISAYEASAAEKGITLKNGECTGADAVFDIKWTSEALANIIDNAIKYTPEGGCVTVSSYEYEMFVRIDVSDNGTGIDENEISKIFARFYRSPSVSDERGVGIGLYLAREILSKEGGYIKVSSKKGEGSLFSLFLPKSGAAQ